MPSQDNHMTDLESSPKIDEERNEEKQPAQIKTTIWKMTKVDIVWCMLGLAVVGFTAYIFSQVTKIRAEQTDVKRYQL